MALRDIFPQGGSKIGGVLPGLTLPKETTDQETPKGQSEEGGDGSHLHLWVEGGGKSKLLGRAAALINLGMFRS